MRITKLTNPILNSLLYFKAETVFSLAMVAKISKIDMETNERNVIGQTIAYFTITAGKFLRISPAVFLFTT